MKTLANFFPGRYTDKLNVKKTGELIVRPKIIAHRGASHLAPENTLAAFRLAAAMGVDGIEFDTLLTADGHLVVHHEYITDLHANANEVLPWCTLAQLRALDFGNW